LGYQDGEISNDIKSWQALIHPADSQIVIANIAACAQSESSAPFIQEVRFMHKTNGFIWILCRSKPLRDEQHKVIAVVSTHPNITELKNAEEKLYRMAHFDELTQLPNRSMFIQLMLEMIEEATRNNTKFVLLVMDLDNFNRVNDSLGHAIGDALLQAVATILKKLTRRYDVVARLGGDEFGIIIKNIHSLEEVGHITQRYIQAFTKSLYIESHEIKTTPSIGLVLFPQYGQTPYELLQNADAAMYYAKQHGKNIFHFFDQNVKDGLLRRHAIDTQLQHALENREFSLAYQFKFDLKTDRPVGVEALIRWNNAKLGEVIPDEFIPIAEENRLIVPIGYWLMEQVIKDYVKMSKLVKHDAFSIAVNMSMIHLREPDFEFQIKQLLFNHHFFSYDKLIFELTETALMERPEIAAGLLRNIAKLGIQFALDDFGTGFSSMQHIKNFPITSLKIDKSFIKDLAIDPAAEAMVKAMIAFTKILGMTVTAEGVETHEQLTFLKKEGCDEAQGFILSKPLPLDELLCFMRTVF
jgi:diguanylate cyclase (GGDEF)-like protein/PAS domain S-box-containing protein